ncbi:MAG TPA: hypothetical protein VFG34_03245 [Sphingopyxis sp.]|nr:hypothetical protein [Sphingopyxis sp.]
MNQTWEWIERARPVPSRREAALRHNLSALLGGHLVVICQALGAEQSIHMCRMPIFLNVTMQKHHSFSACWWPSWILPYQICLIRCGWLASGRGHWLIKAEIFDKTGL